MALLTSDLRPLTSGKQRRAAFTLVELMTVIAIIAILAGLILGVSGYATRKADRGRAITDINKLQNALEEYRLNRNSYPGASASSPVSSIFATLTNSLPKDFDKSELHLSDPWDNPYLYQRQRTFQYRLWSTGPDSADPADDITVETGGQ